MEYVQRAVYRLGHELDFMMHDRVHLSDGKRTLCGAELNEMWFVTGSQEKVTKEVTCSKCKAINKTDTQ